MTLLRYVIRIWLLKIIILFSIMLITMIGMPLGFGESPILIQTDKKEYSIGDDIILQGTVKFVNGNFTMHTKPVNIVIIITNMKLTYSFVLISFHKETIEVIVKIEASKHLYMLHNGAIDVVFNKIVILPSPNVCEH